MKFKFKNRFGFIRLVPTLLFIGLLAFLAMPASAQVTSTTLTNITVPTLVTTAVASNINVVISVKQGKQLAIQSLFAAGGSSTATIQYFWAPTVDGTNYATVPRTFAFTCNGTTGVVGETNIPALWLEGYKAIKFTVVTNNSAQTVYLTNFIVGWRN